MASAGQRDAPARFRARSSARIQSSAPQFVRRQCPRLTELVVLDVNLPDGAGWDVLRWLRTAHLHPAMIVYSAVPLSRKRVAEFHPDAVLMKPFPMDCQLDLVATVGSAEWSSHRGGAVPEGDPPARPRPSLRIFIGLVCFRHRPLRALNHACPMLCA
jgi:CheY-like chemotaxis protein